eukprot:gene741-856_t
MSLKDGTKKMSKSDPSDLSRINLMDDQDAISKKIRKAKTDPDALPSETEGLKGRPEADNLVGIFAALADKSKADVLSEFGGQQFSVFKPALIDLAVEVLAPINAEMRRLMEDPGHIDAVLRDGGERARTRAEKTMNEVADAGGCARSPPALHHIGPAAGFSMVSTRLSRLEGHRRKFMAVIDNTPECSRAVHYAGRRAKNSNGGLVLIYVIPDGDFQQ